MQGVSGRLGARFSSQSAAPWLAATAGLYAAVMALTRPVSFGDTIFYVRDILAAGHQLRAETLRPLLDFGHLLWRPLGWSLTEFVRVVAPWASQGDQRILVTRILIAVSLFAGGAAILTLYLTCRRLAFRPVVSFLTCAVFACSSAVIYGSTTGLSYMLALALLIGAVGVVIAGEPVDRPTLRYLLQAGALMALSVATWFPFILVIPAMALAAAVRWGDAEDLTLRRLAPMRAMYFVAAAAAGGAVIYGAAAIVLGIHSMAGITAWIQRSAHGWRQSANLLRLGMGLPRCCLPLTEDAGVPWKRFFFNDPFARVRLRDVIDANLLWIIVFYFGLALLLYMISRGPKGRVFLAMLALAAAPVLLFAVFLFEPSGVERFMPVFPFYFIALGYQLDSAWPNPQKLSLALVYPVVLVVSSITANNVGAVDRYWSAAQTRLELLKQRVPAGSSVALLVNSDPVFSFAADNPLRDTLSGSFEFWVVLRPANKEILCWRGLFASEVLAAWSKSSETWVSDRLLAAAPLPEWGWVEGDDRAISWHQVPEFFRQLQFDEQIGSSDGFRRVAQTQDNRILLDEISDQACKANASGSDTLHGTTGSAPSGSLAWSRSELAPTIARSWAASLRLRRLASASREAGREFRFGPGSARLVEGRPDPGRRRLLARPGGTYFLRSTAKTDCPHGGCSKASTRDCTGTIQESKSLICFSDCSVLRSILALNHHPKNPTKFMY